MEIVRQQDKNEIRLGELYNYRQRGKDRTHLQLCEVDV